MTNSTLGKRTGGMTGAHTLVIFLAVFAIVAGVNAFFVWSAVSTFSGLAGEDDYRKGLAYNTTLTEAAEQKRLGWQAALSVSNGSVLSLTLTDASGAPLDGYSIAGTLERPAASQFDRTLSFVPAGSGHYQAPLSAAGYGTWIATLNVSRPGSGTVFRWKERLWLPPAG